MNIHSRRGFLAARAAAIAWHSCPARPGREHAGMMGGMAVDLNDYGRDACLANERALSEPEVVQVESGGSR